MGAPKKGSHKGTPSGGSRGEESAPRKSRSVSLSKTPRPAHQRYHLGIAKENPGHGKGSKARHLPGQAEPRCWKTKPREAGPLSFQACKQPSPNGCYSVLEKEVLHSPKGSFKERGVKAAKRTPSGGGYSAGRHQRAVFCLWVQPLGKCCKDHQALQKARSVQRSNVSRPTSG